MKTSIFIFIIFIFINSAFSKVIKSQIDSVDKGTRGEPHLVLFDDGSVGFLDYKDKSLIKHIEQLAENDILIEATLDDHFNLVGIKISEDQSHHEWNSIIRPLDNPYRPTVVTRTQATSIFTKMRRDFQRVSQCYNRAHVWTYDEYARSRTLSSKVFLFFTSSYIRKYRYHWWFHVTPMLHVGGSTSAYWRMLDRRYTRGPLTSKIWTDIFIKSKRACPYISKYSSYRNNQRSQDCYLYPVSMYYLVPSDLERLEKTGEARTSYDEVDVDFARWEAFSPK